MVADTLFQPFQQGALALPSRIVMAPMTRRFSPDGLPGEDVLAYYVRRAAAGVGLIITEGTAIDDPAALAEANIPVFHGPDALTRWTAICNAVHAAGGRIFPQLWHVGAARKPENTSTPHVPAVSPSGLFAPDQPNGEALTAERIDKIILAYGQAAADARAIGFDGIELHFAHGYLVDQFFWAPTNLRDDAYGAERHRIGLEIVRECRRRTAPDFPISMRFSQWKQQDYDARLFASPQELDAFVVPMADAGVDIFHCSNRRFWTPEFDGSSLNLAGWTKKLTGRTVITVGSVGLSEEFLVTRTGVNPDVDAGHFDRLEEMLANGEVDLVAVGRALIGDPEWAAKVRDGQIGDIQPFSRDALANLV